MQNLKENIIVDKTFSFSLEILKYAELLEEERKFVLCNQLLRSGTSIGANVREAQNAELKVYSSKCEQNEIQNFTPHRESNKERVRERDREIDE